ncbi:hypothetical protein ACLMJK_004932 [Lecanora helva]
MGFGGTDAPRSPPESISYYSYKRAADDIRGLARQLGCGKFILGGHDWGGVIVYRVALWYPEVVTHVFVVCTPYTAPSRSFTPLKEMVKTRVPNFGYQIQLASGKVEEHIKSKEEIKRFLNALYGGKGPNGEQGFEVTKGVLFENLDKLRPTRLMSEEVLDYYAEQLRRKEIGVPVLFIQATRDQALPPVMSEGMERYIPKLTRESVGTSHWALWEAPQQVNDLISHWLEKVGNPRSTI